MTKCNYFNQLCHEKQQLSAHWGNITFALLPLIKCHDTCYTESPHRHSHLSNWIEVSRGGINAREQLNELPNKVDERKLWEKQRTP